MKIKITARTRIQYTTDFTGRAKTADELQQQAESPVVGNIDVEIYEGEMAIIRFSGKVINGRRERFVALPRTKGQDGEWKDTFELGNEIDTIVRHNGLRAMRDAETDKKTRKTAGGIAEIEEVVK